MHLDSGPVEFVVDDEVGPEERKRGVEVVGGCREHRFDGASDLQADPRQRLRAEPGQRGGDRQRTGQHVRAAHQSQILAGDLRDGVGHDTGQRPLPQFTGEQCHEELLLGLG